MSISKYNLRTIWFMLMLVINTMSINSIADQACGLDNSDFDGASSDIKSDGFGHLYITGFSGLYRSCDSGLTWAKPEVYQSQAFSIAIDPIDSSKVYYSSSKGVYRSNDFGETFELTGNDLLIDIYALVIKTDGTLITGAPESMYKSNDGGDNWSSIPNTNWGEKRVIDILIDPLDNNIIYAAKNHTGIYKSVDGGDTWEFKDLGAQATAIWELEFDPLNNDSIFAMLGFEGIWQSLDAGNSWNKANAFTAVSLAFDPNDASKAYSVSFRDGIRRSIDGGATWISSNQGIPQQRPEFISIDVQFDGVVIAGAQLGGIYRSDNQGLSWQLTASQAEDEPPPVDNSDGTAQISVETTLLNGDKTVPVGTNAKVRIKLTNNGPDISTETVMNFLWSSQPLVGSRDYYSYTATTSQGSCSKSQTDYCQIGSISSGSSVTVEFSGLTAPRMKFYDLEISFQNEQGYGGTEIMGIGTSISISSSDSGAGSSDLVILLMLFLIMLVYAVKKPVQEYYGSGYSI